MTHHIDLNQVSIEFPIYGGASRSLKKAAVKAAVGGLFGRDKAGELDLDRQGADRHQPLAQGGRQARAGRT